MKILHLYLQTGAGHVSCAETVVSAIKKHRGDGAENILIDGLGKKPSTLKIMAEKGYHFAQTRVDFLWSLVYALHFIPFFRAVSLRLVEWGIRSRLSRIIRGQNPDKVIVYHHLLVKAVGKILRKHAPDAGFFVYVTDPYTAHPIWFGDRTARYILFSEEAAESAKRRNIQPERILSLSCFCVNENFESEPDGRKIEDLKRELNVKSGRKTVLVLGGGEGMPNGERLLSQMCRRLAGINIIIVCGRNERQRFRAGRIMDRHPEIGGAAVGYTRDVKEIIALSDIVVGKAGASTVFEILRLKKFLAVYRYLWGQEKGNMEFVVRNGFGIYERNPARLVSTLQDLLGENGRRAAFEYEDCKKEIVDLVCGQPPS